MTGTYDPYVIKCHFALNPGSKIVDISMKSALKHKNKKMVIQINFHHKRKMSR